MSMNDGGCAFPSDSMQSTYHGNRIPFSPGMSLRDYFAAKALPCLLSQYADDARIKGWDEHWQLGVAVDAYAIADAMLKAREVKS